MKFNGFEIHAIPAITDAYCKCGGKMQEVADGFLSKVMYCPKCESVYALRLVKVPKVTEEFLKQCREEVGEMVSQGKRR